MIIFDCLALDTPTILQITTRTKWCHKLIRPHEILMFVCGQCKENIILYQYYYSGRSRDDDDAFDRVINVNCKRASLARSRRPDVHGVSLEIIRSLFDRTKCILLLHYTLSLTCSELNGLNAAQEHNICVTAVHTRPLFLKKKNYCSTYE